MPLFTSPCCISSYSRGACCGCRPRKCQKRTQGESSFRNVHSRMGALHLLRVHYSSCCQPGLDSRITTVLELVLWATSWQKTFQIATSLWHTRGWKNTCLAYALRQTTSQVYLVDARALQPNMVPNTALLQTTFPLGMTRNPLKLHLGSEAQLIPVRSTLCARMLHLAQQISVTRYLEMWVH